MLAPVPSPLKPRILAIERQFIIDAIREHGSRVKAARALGITTQTLRMKLGKPAPASPSTDEHSQH